MNERKELYLTHYIMQSCGWVKIAEYACLTRQQVESIKDDVIARHPNDVLRFEVR